MACLYITLFGPFRAGLDGEAVTAFSSNKVRGLLAYLAVEAPRVFRRDSLAALLWPHWPDKGARTNLRYALSDLRSAIGDREAEPAYLTITRETIQFNMDSDHSVDVLDFTEMSSPGESEVQDVDRLVEAVNLYQGEFLEGFSISDSPPYQEWTLLKREQLHRQLVDALRQLSAVFEGKLDYEHALMYARRQVELESWQEDGHRQVMRLLAASGQPGAALVQYETCRQLLKVDLGTEPSEQTQMLYQQIQKGEWGSEGPEAVPISVQPPRPLGECPYRGLAAFREQDAPYFFGRESYVEQLAETLQQERLVAVILGSSGSGKSSVVYAGLLPRLRKSEDWLVVDLRPGKRPSHALAGAMIPLLEPGLNETDRLVETRKLAQALRQGDISLQDVVERVLETQPDRQHLLLFIDQFEELYTLCPEPETQRRFLDGLLMSVESEQHRRRSRLVLLLTLRADFMGQALAYRPFADALQNASLMLGPMNADELRAAVERPAEKQDAFFEEGLVDRILDDVGDEPGKLPLLEFSLTLLWEGAASGTLTHATYDRVGRVEGALARYADDVYSDLDESDQEIARRVFVQLVQPGVGTEDTRRVASRAEIGEVNWTLTQYLADRHLVVTGLDIAGRETVEVVHEALIQRWERLSGWIEEDRTFRTWQESLRVAIHQWENTDRDDGGLLRGVPLSQAESWLAERGSDLSPVELGFIQASLDLRLRRQVERERLRRRIIVGLSVGLVITLILSAFAGLQWWQAGQQRNSALQAQATAAAERDQTESALAGLLAAQSRNLLGEQYDLGLLLSVESVSRVDTVEGRGSLYNALNHSPQLAKILHGHQDDVRSVAFHPDDRILASGSADGEIILWETTTGQPLIEPLKGHQGQVNSLAFSPDGDIMASAGFDDVIILWDVDETSSTFGQPVSEPLTGHGGNIWTVAFSPDGRILISGGADGKIISWDMAEGSPTYGQATEPNFSGHDGIVTSLSFRPDGVVLASGSADKTVILWDVETKEPIGEPLTGHGAFVSSVAFSPDGRSVASGSKDNTIRLWDVDQSSTSFAQLLTEPLTGHTDSIWDLTFNPEGDYLVSSSEDGTLLLWDVDPDSASFGQPLKLPLEGHAGKVFTLASSEDGKHLVSGGEDNKVILWDAASSHPLMRELVKVTDNMWFVAFSPDRKRLAWSSIEGGTLKTEGLVHLWDMEESSASFGQHLTAPMVGHSAAVNQMDFSPDGKLLASSSDDDRVFLWNVDENSTSFGQPIGDPLEGHAADVWAVIFSPNGKILTSGGDDPQIILWDVDQASRTFGQPIGMPLNGHSDRVWSLAISPDGKTLASGSLDSTIRLWDVDPESDSFGQELCPPLEGHVGEMYEMKFNSEGSIFASGGGDGTIRLWDVNPGSTTFGQQLGPPLKSGPPAQYALKFSPDSKYLATGDINGTILLWDIERRRAIELSGSGGDKIDSPAMMIYFNENSLLATFQDGRILKWDLNIETWQAVACQRANRNLTLEEWQQFFGNEPYRVTCPGLPLEPSE